MKERMRTTKSITIQIMIYITYMSLASNCLAKDFGSKGHSYPIAEQPFLEMIEKRLSRVDIEAEHQKMQEKARQKVEEPDSVIGIAKAEKDRTFYYDPTYVLGEDIKLPSGKILHKAGAQFNPLEYMNLDRRLFFLNSNDPKQIEWLKTEIANPGNYQDQILEDRVILVAGRPFDLQEEISKEVYFDQLGRITSQLGIKAVPAIAVQDGLKVKIEEVVIE